MVRSIYPTGECSNKLKAHLVYGICQTNSFLGSYDWWNETTHRGNVNHPSFDAAEAFYDEILLSVEHGEEHEMKNPVAVIARNQRIIKGVGKARQDAENDDGES